MAILALMRSFFAYNGDISLYFPCYVGILMRDWLA